MNLLKRIQKGLNGDYQGLSNGFNRINNYIFGVQKGVNTLIGGASGTYKTTLLDFIVSNAIQDAQQKGIKLNIFYYSYEIDEITKKCNWLSGIIYRKYKVEIPPEKIKGLGNNRLSEKELELVNTEIPLLDEMFSKINFRFTPMNPTGIYKELFNFGESIGKVEYGEYIDDYGKIQKKIIGYKPNNPDEVTLVLLDHMSLVKKELVADNKGVIDKYSEYCVLLRNLFGFSFINLQQFNDGLKEISTFGYFFRKSFVYL